MLASVTFRNFKALRNTTLPLAPFTLLLGPNGSGKSTALQGLQAAALPANVPNLPFESIASVGLEATPPAQVEVQLTWNAPLPGARTLLFWRPHGRNERKHVSAEGAALAQNQATRLDEQLNRFRFYALDFRALAQPVALQPNIDLGPNGLGLAGVLEHLRDDEPERFDALNQEVFRWLPEYDRVLLNTPAAGQKGIALRTRQGRYSIPAAQLSQGTLLALALLTLAYLPTPLSFIGLEEPDRGIHPRLLRELRDALYRLSYPESCGENRAPVQVLVTTHSPYLLDLYRDHPEEIVLAHKMGLDVRFERLADKPDFEEILGDAPLSEVWYSGILGGIPQPS